MPHRPRRWRPHALRCYRLAVLAAIVLLVRDQHRWWRAQLDPGVGLAQASRYFSDATALGSRDPETGIQTVRGAGGERLGFVLKTLPEANDIVGYAGPSDTLVALDLDGAVIGAALLRSEDTADHVAEVIGDEGFWLSFRGLQLGSPGGATVDAVSGATLTSSAVARGVLRRLGAGQLPSLFPRPVTAAEVAEMVPGTTQLEKHPWAGGARRALDATGRPLATVLRTSPQQDAFVGYQGPSDLLVAIDRGEERILGVRLRSSFDNDDYVEIVQSDPLYLSLYDGWALADVAGVDFGAAGIEGVSGATITSWAVAEGVRRRVATFLEERKRAATAAAAGGGVAWLTTLGTRDVGAVAVLVIATAIAFSRRRGDKRLRLVWRVAVIFYVGFLTGDMVTQALLAGWAQSGLPWAIAPGLVLLVAAAFLLPWATGKQVYCHQICPHGAAQELLVGLGRRRYVLPARAGRVLEAVPAVLLVFVLAAVLLALPVNLASIEAFDAYLPRIAGWAAISIALVGLAASAFVPMAYCRYGCPTGLLLKFVRSRGAADQFGTREGVALALVALAAIIVFTRESWLAVA